MLVHFELSIVLRNSSTPKSPRCIVCLLALPATGVLHHVAIPASSMVLCSVLPGLPIFEAVVWQLVSLLEILSSILKSLIMIRRLVTILGILATRLLSISLNLLVTWLP